MPKDQKQATTENDVVIGGPDVSGIQNDGKDNPDEGAAAKKGAEGGDENAPKTKTVKIGTKEFVLPEDVADELTGQMNELTSIVDEIRAGATQDTKQKPVKEETQNDEYDFSTGIFVEPGVALARLKEDIKKEIRAEYEQAQATEKLWNHFYSENKDLKEMEILVGAVFNKNYAALKDMQADKAMSKLATLVREEALKLGVGKKEKAGGSEKDQTDRTTVEGASAPGTKNNSSQKQTDEVPSLSAIIRQRQEARRKAANH